MKPFALLALSLPTLVPPAGAQVSFGAHASSLPDPAALLPDASRRPVLYQRRGPLLWARGATYKASFGTTGAVYHALSATRATPAPIRLELERILLGGEPLAFREGVEPTRQDDVVSYERGSVSERYRMTTTSMEQLFVFDELPWRAELEIRVDLACRLACGDAGDRFVVADAHGRTELTKAIALDGAGREWAVPTRIEQGQLVLRVPADVVRSARLPLTIDPVISTFDTNAVFASAVNSVDVAYHAGQNRFLVVWAEGFGLTDIDAFAMAVEMDGSPGGVFPIDVSDELWSHPAVAAHGTEPEFMVVASVQEGPFDDARLDYVKVQSATLTVGPVATVPHTDSADNTQPDVGGGSAGYVVAYYHNAGPGGTKAIRTWMTRLDHSSLIGFAPGGLTTPRIPSASLGDSFPVVWREQTDQRRAFVAIVSSFFVQVGLGEEILDVADLQSAVPSPEFGSGHSYLLAYRASGEVFLRVMRGEDTLSEVSLASLDGLGNIDRGQPSVDLDGCHLVLSYDVRVSLFNFDVVQLVVAVDQDDELGIVEGPVFLATGPFAEGTPVVATAGKDTHRSLTVWKRSGNTSSPAGFSGATFEHADPGDPCEDPAPVPGIGLGSFPFDNRCATTDPYALPNTLYQDIWLQWLAPASGRYAVAIETSSIPMGLAVYSGLACPPGAPLGFSAGVPPIAVFDALAGRSYRIRIGALAPLQFGSGTFGIHEIDVDGLGLEYCTSAPNSVAAQGARIAAAGSTSVLANDLTLRCDDLPPGVPGIFFGGNQQLAVPFGEGIRCAGGVVLRMPIGFASPNGVSARAIDQTVYPELAPGTTWNFQHWYRDPSGGPIGFNLSNALELFFTF